MLIRGLAGAILVALGSLVTSVVPESSWVAALPVASNLGETTSGRMFALALVVAGLGLMVWSWLAVGRSILAGSRHQLNRYAAVWAAPLLLAPPLFSRDAWSYAAQGALVAKGYDPYQYGPGMLSGPVVEAVDPMWKWTPAPYGPIPLAYGGLAAHLTQDPYILVLLHRLLAVLGFALIAYSVPRLATACRVDPVVATWLVVLNPMLIAHGVGAAHNDILMIGAGCFAFTQALSGRWGTAAVLAGMAAAVKLPGGLVVIGIAAVMSPLAARIRTRIASLFIVGTIAVVSLVTIGELTGIGSGWLGALGVPGQVRSPFSVANLLGIGSSSLLDFLGAEGAALQALEVFRLAGIAAALGVIAVMSLRSSIHHSARAIGVAMLAIVLLGPTAHDWYFLWCLPFLAVARPGRRVTTAMIGVSIVFTVAAPLNSSLRGAIVQITVTTALVVVIGAALLGILRTMEVSTGTERAERVRHRGGEARVPVAVSGPVHPDLDDVDPGDRPLDRGT